jgi:hypothetical protein
MRQLLFIGLTIGILTVAEGSDAISRGQESKPIQLAHEHAALIAEAYHLWKAHGEKLWPGWTDIPMPIL